MVEVVGVVIAEVDAEAEEVDDATVGALNAAPIRCCNNSAIRIVVLSIADFGR